MRGIAIVSSITRATIEEINMEDWEKKLIIDSDPDDIFLKRYLRSKPKGLMNPFEDFKYGDIVGGIIGLSTYGIVFIFVLIALFNCFCRGSI